MAVDPDRWADLPQKVEGLAAVARDRGIDTLVLRDPANLTWLLGGRVNVPQTLDSACLDVVVHFAPKPRITLVTNAIEAPRLRDAELAGLAGLGTTGDVTWDVTWDVVDWWDGRGSRLPSGTRVGSDRPAPDAMCVGADLARLRRRLTPRQRQLLRSVCADVAAAATVAAAGLTPATTGYQAAGLLAHELLDRELDPIVLLVGGATQLEAHRHPLPTHDPLGVRGMLVACGRRHGLVASVTRIVSFAPLSPEERDAYERLLAVEQVFLDASSVGARLGDIVVAGTGAYAAHGFAPDEWHRHHQGGLSGFQPREFPASATSDEIVTDGSVLAWNPSAAGWKVEDTTLVEAGGPETLVHDDTWPTITVGDRLRPDVLVR